MANGYCPALLRHINDIAEGNAPGNKLHVAGFLAMTFCCQNSTVSPVNDGNQANGHRRTLTVKYRKRPTADSVQDTDNCDVNRIPAYNEWTIPNLGFKSSSWWISDDEIRKYCDEASQRRNLGIVPGVMQEHYETFLEHANLLLREINKDIVTDMATQFGNNITTGGSTGKVINISRDGDKYILDNGVIDIMRDLQENEVCGDPCIVGGGLFSAYNIAQAMTCCNQAGLDISRIGLPRFFFDKDTQAIWGENSIGLFAPNTVKFMGWNAYTGAFAGEKGGSIFTTIPLPVGEFGCNSDDCLRDLVFDLQVRYLDCPTEVEVNGTPTVLNRGWQFILSKRYALWVQPDDGYEEEDELAGTNGTLKYFISNSTDSSGSYGYGS